MICINGMQDHVHILFGMHPNQSLSNLVKEIKGHSSKWINENKFVVGKFEWQEGFGGFSYSKSQISEVVKYIENQEIHHKKKTFKEEYIEFLKKYDVKFDEKFIFKDLL